MTTSLRAVDRQLLFVQRLLVEDGDDAASRSEAMRLLRDVEQSLTRGARESASRAFAFRLLRVSSELRVHLAATATLEDIGRPARSVIGMLKRAVDTTPGAPRRAVRVRAHPQTLTQRRICGCDGRQNGQVIDAWLTNVSLWRPC
jgi:hypothetical protein